MIVLMDSGPLGRLVEGDRLFQARLRRAHRQGHTFEVPPAVRAEMFAAAWKDRTLRTRLQQVLAAYGGDSTSIEEGSHAGELLARVPKDRGDVSLVDALVAAAAHRRKAAVLTDDSRDFARLRAAGARHMVMLSF
ncbi:MAG: PIN domain-containing protein [Candidatus Dormibacteria bacterium]